MQSCVFLADITTFVLSIEEEVYVLHTCYKCQSILNTNGSSKQKLLLFNTPDGSTCSYNFNLEIKQKERKQREKERKKTSKPQHFRGQFLDLKGINRKFISSFAYSPLLVCQQLQIQSSRHLDVTLMPTNISISLEQKTFVIFCLVKTFC